MNFVKMQRSVHRKWIAWKVVVRNSTSFFVERFAFLYFNKSKIIFVKLLFPESYTETIYGSSPD